MKKLFCLAALVSCLSAANAQGVYTRQCDDEALKAKATQWVESGAWKNGFNGALPHQSVNTVDFYEQYQRNPQQWNALFKWLSETDLKALPAGRHAIEGSDMVASVEDDKNAPYGVNPSESHRQKIDFQYCVSGTERFGLLDHTTSTPNCEYKPDVIHYDYDKDLTQLYDSTPDRFFLFFPDDWHIAKINNDTDDQQIRVIVVKIDYKQQ